MHAANQLFQRWHTLFADILETTKIENWEFTISSLALYAHSNAYKPPKSLKPTIFMLETILTEMY